MDLSKSDLSKILPYVLPYMGKDEIDSLAESDKRQRSAIKEITSDEEYYYSSMNNLLGFETELNNKVTSWKQMYELFPFGVLNIYTAARYQLYDIVEFLIDKVENIDVGRIDDIMYYNDDVVLFQIREKHFGKIDLITDEVYVFDSPKILNYCFNRTIEEIPREKALEIYFEKTVNNPNEQKGMNSLATYFKSFFLLKLTEEEKKKYKRKVADLYKENTDYFAITEEDYNYLFGELKIDEDGEIERLLGQLLKESLMNVANGNLRVAVFLQYRQVKKAIFMAKAKAIVYNIELGVDEMKCGYRAAYPPENFEKELVFDLIACTDLESHLYSGFINYVNKIITKDDILARIDHRNFLSAYYSSSSEPRILVLDTRIIPFIAESNLIYKHQKGDSMQILSTIVASLPEKECEEILKFVIQDNSPALTRSRDDSISIEDYRVLFSNSNLKKKVDAEKFLANI